MTDSEFFAYDQSQWFEDFVDTEVFESFPCTSPHNEKFEFDDVPY